MNPVKKADRLGWGALVVALVAALPACQPLMTAIAMSPFGWPFGFMLRLPAAVVMLAGVAEILALAVAIKTRRSTPAKAALATSLVFTAVFALGELFLIAAAFASR